MTMSEKVAEDQWVPALDMVLKATPAHWWATHKQTSLPGMQCN